MEGRDIMAKPRLGNKHIFIPDTQIQNGVPTNHLEALGNYIVDKKPDVIVHIGDHWDMPSLSSYEKKGSKYFENRRYLDDIESGIEAMEILLKPLNEYNTKRRSQKMAMYKPRKVFITGNHECFDDKTECLTRRGWLHYTDIKPDDFVFTLNNDLTGVWQPIKNIHCNYYIGEMYTYESSTVSMSVTPNHRVLYTSNGSGRLKYKTANQSPSNCDLFVASKNANSEYSLTDEQIEYIGVAVTDSHHTKHGSLIFYQSGAKADRIEQIIKACNISYTKTARQRNTTHICGKKLKNKPQTSYEFRMKRPDWCPNSNKKLPDFVYNFSHRQFKKFLDMLIFCDGSIPKKNAGSRVFYGQKQICDDVQKLCIINGVRASITEYRENQFRVNIAPNNVVRVDGFLNTTTLYEGEVWCLSVENENFMVRRNNKAYFSGNSRISRAVNEDPKLEGVITTDHFQLEKFSWEVHPFLEVVDIDGVKYSHYFINPDGLMGRPIGGNIHNKLKILGHSFSMGHQQTYEVGVKYTGDGRRLRGLIAGSFYQHDEEYLGPQKNRQHWRGAILKTEVREGNYDLVELSMEYLLTHWL